MLISAAFSSSACVAMGADSVPGNCAGWWKCVYSPKRLVIQQPCVTVRGTVIKTKYVPDGDVIVIVTLDPEYTHFANEKNDEHYGKNTLELELVCRTPISRFLVWRCWRCRNKLLVPRVGDHVEADGVYVLDVNHGHMEVHPVSRMRLLPVPPP